MGFLGKVGNRVRTILGTDKESAAREFSKGARLPDNGQTANLLQAHGYEAMASALQLDTDLMSKYADYESQDDYGEIATALDIYADDCTVPSAARGGRTLWVTSPDADAQTLIDDFFHRTLRIDEDLWEMARSLCKYGSDFNELLITENGVEALQYLPAPMMRRVEGRRGELFGFVQEFKGRINFSPEEFQAFLKQRQKGQDATPVTHPTDEVIAFEPFEIMHLRLKGKNRRSMYGTSTLENCRWIFKRLILLEDAAIFYRLERSPQRLAHYIDTGDLPPSEALAFVNRVRQQYRKKRFVDPQNANKINLKFEPLGQSDDYWIPTRKGVEGARIEVVGSPSWQAMDDINYFKDKLFAALKVPRAYLGQEEGVARASLSSQDCRFARTVLRVQREMISGLRKAARVHMAALGIDPGKVEYELHMTVPSAILELAQIEVRNAQADLAARLRDFVSLNYIMSTVFGLSDEEIATIFREQEDEAMQTSMRDAKIAMAQQSLNPQPQQPQQEASAEQGAGGQDSENPKQQQTEVYIPYRLNRPSRKELFERDKSQDAKLEKKLDALLKSDLALQTRLNEINQFIRELRFSLQFDKRR